MEDPLGTAIAFSVLGANVLATGLLLLLNPRSRAVRWYAGFLTAVSLWLLALGMLSITGDFGGRWREAYASAVFLMPGLFLASSLAHDRGAAKWLPWGALALTVPAVPLGVAVMTTAAPDALDMLALAWQVAGWGGASYLQWRSGRRERPVRPERRRSHRVVSGILIVPGMVVAGAMLLGGETFFTYVMPLLVLVIHFIVFFGVVRLRFYDIEVRAARSGETAARAMEAERLAAVGELAASVAHEVRNPLTGIRSLAQRMAEADVDVERWRRYSRVIVEEIGRVDRIVGNLLDLARRSPVETHDGEQSTELATLFEDLVLLTRARAERSGVTLRAEADGVVAPTAREPLAQVLLNLLLNAIQHSSGGGTVRLVAEGQDPVAISVADSGPGVPPEERERIFEPFHAGRTNGSGLGLSVVRRVARERGWRVTVEDAPGGGAEFRLTLPAGVGGVGERGSVPGAESDPRTGGATS